jgi:sarcosine oxidase subunit beta
MGKTIICFCEDVTLEELQSAIEQGYRDIESIKRFTGIATGPCQGKECLANALKLLLEAGEISDRPPVQLPSIRQPVVPIRIDDLAAPETEGPE